MSCGQNLIEGRFEDLGQGAIDGIKESVIDPVYDVGRFLYVGWAENLLKEGWKWFKHLMIPDLRRDREAMVSASTGERRIIYGKTRVGGNLVYAETSGGQDQELVLVVAFAGHEVSSIDEIWFNDQLVASRGVSTDYTGTTWTINAPFTGYAALSLHRGDQVVADTLLLSKTHGGWTTDHKLLGICYGVFVLTYNENVYVKGIPQVKAVISGKKVYNPATLTTAWSDNPALCIRDYMLMTAETGGMGCDSSEVDDTSIIAAAAICDQTVTIPGGSEKRYTLNGFIGLSNTPAAILKSMLPAMSGQALYSGAVWSLYAGAAATPVAALDESWLNGGISFSAGANKNDRINTVKGTFVNPLDHWADSEFPPVISSTYLAEDGEELTADLVLPFTTSQYAAQRLAAIELAKSRFGMTVTCPCNKKAEKLKPMDVVTVTNSLLGWSSRQFRVLTWEHTINGGVNLQLVDDTADIWTDPAAYDELPTPTLTNLPTPWAVTVPSGLTVSETLYTTVASGIYKSRLDLSWSSGGASGTQYDIYFDDKIIVTTYDTSYSIYDVDPGSYTVKIRARNALGAVSAWVLSSPDPFVVAGKAAPPGDVSGFTATADLNNIILRWTNNSDADLAGYEIRVGGADWSSATMVARLAGNLLTVKPAASGSYTYRIKAIDNSGNYSASAAGASATVTQIDVAVDIVTAGSTAIWSSVTGTGKPEDNATKNSGSSSADTPPASPHAGDTWFNSGTTDGTYKALTGYTYTGSAWVQTTPRGTYIGTDGIYTGTLTASQVNAVAIDAASITAGTMTARTVQTASSGKRMLLNASTNEAEFYGAKNVAGDVVKLCTVGSNTTASYESVVYIGAAGMTKIALEATSEYNGPTVKLFGQGNAGSSTSVVVIDNTGTGHGVTATGATSFLSVSHTDYGFEAGVSADANGYGMYAGCRYYDGSFHDNKGPLILQPSLSSSAPSHSAQKGTLWVTSSGVLYINTDGGTTWGKVGAQ